MATIKLDLAAIDTNSLQELKESIELELYHRARPRFSLPVLMTEELLKTDLKDRMLVLDPRDRYYHAVRESFNLSTYRIDKVDVNPYRERTFPHYRIHLVNGDGESVYINTCTERHATEWAHDNLIWVQIESLRVSQVSPSLPPETIPQ